ncbi:hypothetical protein VNO77_16813 [Canavalia gladiata]|uniref:Phytocyanin domain-containing protein n=1 Tax=Canavalia gladiata TaxID=3824 RepID=A0AAN9LLI3_CANGL
MGSAPRLAFLAISMVLLFSIAMATDHVVGDDKGWTTDIDYSRWAQDKVFHVGDNLVFNYDKNKHNVFKLNMTQFHNCTFPPENNGYSSGNDVIPLKAEGKKWYGCGKGNHCASHQMKFAINVVASSPAPAPSPTSSAHSSLSSLSHFLIIPIIAVSAIFA